MVVAPQYRQYPEPPSTGVSHPMLSHTHRSSSYQNWPQEYIDVDKLLCSRSAIDMQVLLVKYLCDIVVDSLPAAHGDDLHCTKITPAAIIVQWVVQLLHVLIL